MTNTSLPSVFHPCFIRGFVYFVAIVILSGCGSTYDAAVYGTASLDGQPLAKGIVSFHPEDGGAVALATLDESGAYRLQTGRAEGLKPGAYVVTVVSTKGSPSPGMTVAQIEALRITPKLYASKQSSTLRFDVKPGGNEIDLDLLSR